MQNVINTLQALEAISERQPIGVGELSRVLGLPKTTVQRCLTSLAEAGWIRPSEGELTRWILTTKPLVVGIRASGQYGLKDAALPIMQRLRAQVNETTNLTIYEGAYAVLIERLDSTHAVRTFAPLGVRAPLHASAAGRAILSALPEEALNDVLGAPLASYTPHTRTDPAAIRDEVMKIRERGFAFANSEWNDGVVAVAAPIVLRTRDLTSRPGGVLGAISVSGPVFRMAAERLFELGPQLAEAAREIAASIEGSHQGRTTF